MPRRLLSYYEPDDLTGLVAWLKADALGSADGDLIASWTDSSGNSNSPVQATDANKPTYATSVINGKPVLRFDGGDRLVMPDETDFDLATPTIFVVAKRNSGTSGSILSKNTTGSTTGQRRKIQISTGSDNFSYAAGSDSQNIGVTTTPSNWTMFGVVTNSNTSHSLYLNGVETVNTTTMADSTLNNANVEIGAAFSNGAEGFNGDIAEIVVFNRALSNFEVVGLQNYLANKYNLPVSLSLGGAPRVAVSGRVSVRGYGNAIRAVASSGSSIAWTNTPFNSPGIVSACFWLRLQQNTTSIFNVAFGFGNTRWFFIFNSTTNRPSFNIKVSGAEKSSGYITAGLVVGQYYLLCGTYDPSGGSNNLTIRVYDQKGQLYGSNQSTQTGSMDTATAALTFGRDPVRAYNMSIDGDEIHVYSRILTTGEQDEMALGVEPDDTDLELWAQCDETSGSLADSSGNSRTGTNNNCTFITSFKGGRQLAGSGVSP